MQHDSRHGQPQPSGRYGVASSTYFLEETNVVKNLLRLVSKYYTARFSLYICTYVYIYIYIHTRQ